MKKRASQLAGTLPVSELSETLSQRSAGQVYSWPHTSGSVPVSPFCSRSSSCSAANEVPEPQGPGSVPSSAASASSRAPRPGSCPPRLGSSAPAGQPWLQMISKQNKMISGQTGRVRRTLHRSKLYSRTMLKDSGWQSPYTPVTPGSSCCASHKAARGAHIAWVGRSFMHKGRQHANWARCCGSTSQQVEEKYPTVQL